FSSIPEELAFIEFKILSAISWSWSMLNSLLPCFPFIPLILKYRYKVTKRVYCYPSIPSLVFFCCCFHNTQNKVNVFIFFININYIHHVLTTTHRTISYL